MASGYTFILNTPRGCRSVREAPLPSPVRLEIVCRPSQPWLDTVADAMGDRVLDDLAVADLVHECTGPMGSGCIGFDDVEVENLLAVVIDGSSDDGTLDALVDRYLGRGHRVVGVLPTGSDPVRCLPAAISSRVALFYDAAPIEVVPDVVALAGVGVDERRVFVSYAHLGGSHLAERVFDELTRRQFDCYLDRFRTLPGEDFIERIDDELADKAMVVVIESQASAESTWVLFEVLTALARGYGLVAVNVDGGVAHPLIPEALRCRVKGLHNDHDVLEVCQFVQRHHRLAIAQLRRSLAADIRATLARHAPTSVVTMHRDGADVDSGGRRYQVTGSIRPAGVRQARIAASAANPQARPVVYSPIYADRSRRDDQQFLDDETPTAIVPDGLLREAAQLMDRGAL